MPGATPLDTKKSGLDEESQADGRIEPRMASAGIPVVETA